MPESAPSRLEALLGLVSPARLLAGLAAWLALTAGFRPLAVPDEGRYVGIAWSMASAGEWLVPTLDGMPFFHKPPLFYWITELGFLILGPGVWAARLASLAAAVLALAASLFFLRRYQNQTLATVTVLILATQPIFYLGAQFANLDMLAAGLIAATILSGADAVFRAEAAMPWRVAALRTFVLAALGVLAKGLIGVVLPAAIIILWLAWRRAWSSLRVMFWVPGMLAFLLVAGPWFVWMQYRFPDFFDYFVIYHHIQRFSQEGFNNPMPFWFYLPVLLLLALPWTPWLVRGLIRSDREETDAAGVSSLMVIWLLVILVFFSLPSSKLVGYILPALPPLAYLIASPFCRWIRRAPEPASRWFGVTLVIAVLVCTSAVLFLRIRDTTSAQTIAEELQAQIKPGDEIVMVDRYVYDFAFYLRHGRPIWVVSDWDDPDIPTRDTWRKELLDASRFDPEAGRRVLISAAELAARACALRAGSLWVVGHHDATRAVKWLDGPSLAARDHGHLVWHLTPAELRSAGVCGETPRGD